MDTNDFIPLYNMPAHLLRRAAQRVTSVFEAEMGHLGLTASQLGLIIVVHLRPGMEQREIAAATHFDAATLGGVIQRLETQGYLQRRASDRSNRGRAVYLTATGEALYRQIEPHVTTIQQTLLSPLSATEAATFMVLLSKLLGVTNSHHPGPAPDTAHQPDPLNKLEPTRHRRRS